MTENRSYHLVTTDSIRADEAPCFNCICVPICRQINIYTLFEKCSLLRKFYNVKPPAFLRLGRKYYSVIKALNTDEWKDIEKDGRLSFINLEDRVIGITYSQKF